MRCRSVVFPEGHVDEREAAPGEHGRAVVALLARSVGPAVRVVLLRLVAEQPLQREAATATGRGWKIAEKPGSWARRRIGENRSPGSMGSAPPIVVVRGIEIGWRAKFAESGVSRRSTDSMEKSERRESERGAVEITRGYLPLCQKFEIFFAFATRGRDASWEF